MDAITSQLEALMLTSPERNTTRGKKQTSRHSYRCKRTSKAKYNAYYYKTHKYTINRKKAGNASERPGLKQATIKKRNIKWDVNTRKWYWTFMPLLSHSLVWEISSLRLPAETLWSCKHGLSKGSLVKH